MKWLKKLLTVLVVVVLSPLFVVLLLIGGICFLLQIPKQKKQYHNSRYYQDFGLPFMMSLLSSPAYRFYNAYKERTLQAEFIRQGSNGLEYIVYDDTVYLFPDFEQISFEEEKSKWEVNYDGEWSDYETAYSSLVSKLENKKYPVKLLIERKMFVEYDLNKVELPQEIFLTWSYETAFENEASPLKMLIPQTSEMLYEMMLATPELCGKFTLSSENTISWELYEGIQVEMAVDTRDCYISVNRKLNADAWHSITHWHPSAYEMYDEVCELGKHGNILVIRSFAFGDSVLYIGPEAQCPYLPEEKYIFGKMYYLRAEKTSNNDMYPL